MNIEKSFDVIVIGAGHAGCEAALVAARMGVSVLLITKNLDTIALMSCNPAIGGIAKGQIVREIDALGGEMAKITDKSSINSKILNKSKGPAVWSPRAQCDRNLYKNNMKHVLELEKNLFLLQGEVVRINADDNKIHSIETKTGIMFKAKCVIITTGTFLNGLVHVGLKNFPAGRYGEEASFGISKSLVDLGFEVSRLKTGTPPRINARTIDYSKLEIQNGDIPPVPFSHFTDRINLPQLPCWITWTNERTHNIIKDNLDRSPLYTGIIKSIGPRYCPSIEDKVIKFSDKDRHQVFLEPEGINTEEVYCNGISTSLPEDVQEDIVHSLNGCENAKIMRYGYGIEYDFFQPTQLKASLETKKIDGLFFAGQINGTTGYEEAAAQGLVAGINAVLKIRNEEPFILKRSEAYIGVLIDDLVTKGVLDPYRMLTSRAEYRLIIRADNADLRLLDYSKKFGLINEAQYDKFCNYREKLTKIFNQMENKKVEKEFTASDLIRRGENIFEVLKRYNILSNLKLDNDTYWNNERLIDELNIQVRYSGYIKRQLLEVKKISFLENKKIPSNFDYDKVSGLLKEAVIKLKKIKPETLGQASRISGVTPSDISILAIYLKKMNQI